MKTMDIHAFELFGLSFRGGKLSKTLEYLNTGKPAYELSVGSITHADQAALYYAGMLEENGVDTKLPEEVKKTAAVHYKEVHAHRGQGNFNWDGVDYTADVKLPPLTRVPDGYDAVLWMPKPKWAKEGNIYVPQAGEEEPFVAVLPPSGWAVPTTDGLRDRKTGWALATVQSREDAIKQIAESLAGYMDEEKAMEIAKKEVSYSYRRARGDGKSAVFRGFTLYDDGPFYENANWDGGGRNGGLGAFPFE